MGVVFVIIGYVCLFRCLRLGLVVLLEASGLFVVIACGDGERGKGSKTAYMMIYIIFNPHHVC